MGMVAWMILLAVQNAAFTWVSRARNSGSDWYHAVASVFSNGIWLAAFYFTFDYIDRMHTGGAGYIVLVAAAYVTATMIGSVFAGKLLRTFVERGKRRVGYYGE